MDTSKIVTRKEVTVILKPNEFTQLEVRASDDSSLVLKIYFRGILEGTLWRADQEMRIRVDHWRTLVDLVNRALEAL